MRIKSNNPVYGKVINSKEYQSFTGEYAAATYGGVARKTMYFLALVFVGAFLGLWLMQNNPSIFVGALTASALTTFIFALLGFLIPSKTKIFGSLYCLGEGILIGVASLAFEMNAPGVVLTALLTTVIVLAVSVTLFMTNIVKVRAKFMRFLMVFGISMIFSMMMIFLIDLIFMPGLFSILLLPISALSAFLATLYLFFDFQRIYEIVEGGAPVQMEWHVSFGLVYTLVWLYIEILRLVWLFKDSN